MGQKGRGKGTSELDFCTKSFRMKAKGTYSDDAIV